MRRARRGQELDPMTPIPQPTRFAFAPGRCDHRDPDAAGRGYDLAEREMRANIPPLTRHQLEFHFVEGYLNAVKDWQRKIEVTS